MEGKELEFRRKRLGYETRREFAERIDTPFETYKAWETDKNKIPGHLKILIEYIEKEELDPETLNPPK